MAKRQIAIGADPGFDGFKITIGNPSFVKVYNIPFSAIKLTEGEKERISKLSTAGNIIYEADGISMLIGQKAREELTDPDVYKLYKSDVEKFSNIERFDTVFFKHALMTGICYALYLYAADYEKENGNVPYSLENINADANIHLTVCLPHGHFEEYSDTIHDYVDREHKGLLMVNNTKQEISFTPAKSYVGSQAVMVILAQIFNAKGKEVNEPVLPQLIIDAGYKTVGRVLIKASKAFGIHDKSDTDFAMSNIDEEVIAEFNRIEKTSKSPLTKDKVESGAEEIQYKDKNGAIKVFNIKEHKKEITETKIRQFESVLEEEYDGLLNIKQISFAGGTGSAYYGPFVEILREKGYDAIADVTKLIKVELNGMEYDPVYTVSIGAYLNTLSVM